MTEKEFETIWEMVCDIAAQYDQHDGYLPKEKDLKDEYRQRLVLFNESESN